MKEAEKAKDKAEQDGYNIGVTETKKALRAEVSGVCRNYCFQVWNEALNQAKVKASSILKRLQSAYYPPVIRAFSSINSKADTPFDVTEPKKNSPDKVPPSSSNPPKEAE